MLVIGEANIIQEKGRWSPIRKNSYAKRKIETGKKENSKKIIKNILQNKIRSRKYKKRAQQ